MNVEKIEIEVKGYPVLIDAVKINAKYYSITGKFIKTAAINNEWYENVGDPVTVINNLKSMKRGPDIFTFMQLLGDHVPKYEYYNEKEAASALPIISYEHWLENQIPASTRKNIKKAPKRGVEIKIAELDDKLVEDIMGIYNETPVRRGKPFWHYQKDFATVKEILSRDLDESEFICAYFNNELIGYIKLMYRGQLAHPVQILVKMSHRDKFPMNSLIAKAVEICASKDIKYMTYTVWRKGSQAEFLIRNGFVRIDLPRYYIPLTYKGKIALAIGIHKGFRKILPESIVSTLLRLRANFYRIISKNPHEEVSAL